MAHFIVLVERNVQLEEARVRLGEAGVAHALQEVDLVLLAVREVDWQAVPAPDELEVELALLVGELLEDAPETLDDLVISAAVMVLGDALEEISLDCLLAAGPNLDRSRRQV